MMFYFIIDYIYPIISRTSARFTRISLSRQSCYLSRLCFARRQSHPFLTNPRGALLSWRKEFSPCLFRRVDSFLRSFCDLSCDRPCVDNGNVARWKQLISSFANQQLVLYNLHGYEKGEYLKKEDVKKE